MHVNIPLPLACETTLFIYRYGFAEQIPACQLLKIFITLEPYGLFGSNFAYLFILILSSYPGMQNGGESLLSIILAGQGLLEKMLITLKPHGRPIFNQILHTNHTLTLSRHRYAKR